MQPPQNPYNQPNYGQSGYGGQPGYGGPPGYGGQPPRGTVSLDVIGEAWTFVKASIGQWILALLIAGVIGFVLSFIIGLLGVPFGGGGTGTGAGRGQAPGAMFYVITFISQLLNAAIQGVLIAGLLRMAIANIRTGAANLNDFFGVTDSIGSIVIAAILVYLVTVVGVLLCIIPGIIAALGLGMTQPLIVDQKLPPVDAMKRSWDVMKSHLGSYFVLGLVLGLLNVAGALACGVGLFVTVPIYIVSVALVYRDLYGVGGTPGQNMGYNPPPIANPNY